MNRCGTSILHVIESRTLLDEVSTGSGSDRVLNPCHGEMGKEMTRSLPLSVLTSLPSINPLIRSS
jgi:hypothetical protein